MPHDIRLMLQDLSLDNGLGFSEGFRLRLDKIWAYFSKIKFYEPVERNDALRAVLQLIVNKAFFGCELLKTLNSD
jgi:hypothetical protein